MVVVVRLIRLRLGELDALDAPAAPEAVEVEDDGEGLAGGVEQRGALGVPRGFGGRVARARSRGR
jgi:hypothetical protein